MSSLPPKRRLWLIAIIGTFAAGCAFQLFRSPASMRAKLLVRQGDIAKVTPATPGSEHSADADAPFAYLLYGPDKVETGKRLPLVIYLHGGSEGGDKLEVLRRHGPPYLLANGEFPRPVSDFYLVAPQCPYTCRGWPAQDLRKFVESIVARYPVDAERITVTGQSLGGIGTLALLGEEPGRFAGGIALCGYGTEQLASRLVNMPLWLIHGTNDESIPIGGSRQFFAMVQQVGGTQIRFDELPGEGHYIHNEIYRNPEIWDWLLAQRRRSSTL